MNYKKAKTILRKLNSMLESFENLGEPLSDIESEMLMRYSDEFIKLIPQQEDEEEDEAEMVAPIVVEKVKPIKKKAAKKPKVAPAAKKAKAVKVVEEEEFVEEPIIEEIPELAVEEIAEEVIDASEEYDVAPVEETPVVVAKPAKKAAKPKKKPLVANEEEEHEDIDLWAKVEFKELSEKLSFSPIKNIFKSISINERIFTQNELFGGDHLAFRSVLEQLEQKNTFEEAVAFLKGGIAKEQKWDSAKKINKANQFMKLVQRRFV